MQSQTKRPASESRRSESRVGSIDVRSAAHTKRHVGIPSQEALEPELSRVSLFNELLKVRDFERQRIGQELHDSAGQLLVALQLSVAHLRRIEEGSGHDDLMAEIDETVRQIDREIRSLAFLEFPAELSDRGLISAVQSLCRDFGRRTGIKVTFKLTGDFREASEAVSTTVLRVVQEALVNIHRHAHALSARVAIEKCADRLQVTVADDGVGMPHTVGDRPRGIGLQGMRRRIEALGGRFQIRNLKRGTKVSGSLPLAAGRHHA